MKKIVLSFFLCINFIIVNAQSINNKNCTIDESDLIKSNFDNFSIYKQITKGKDSIFSKNFIWDSDNYFDLIAIKINKRKYWIEIIEYSPDDKKFWKSIVYKFNIKKDRIEFERIGYGYQGCLGIPVNFNWDKELKYSKLMEKSIFLRLFKEMIANN